MKSRLARYSVALLLLVPLAHTQAFAHHSEEEQQAPVGDLKASIMGFEARYLAEDTGMTPEEAYDALMRQDRIGELQAALVERGPASFGGLFVEYQPEYAIKTLATPGGGPAVLRAIDTLGFADLGPFVSVKETVLTEQALLRAQGAIGRSRSAPFSWTDIDLVGGKVLMAVPTANDVEPGRAAVRRMDLGGVDPDRVDVFVSGKVVEEDSYGGLVSDIPNSSIDCTTGWTVLQDSTGIEGMANADHCDANDNKERIGHHSDVALEWVDGKNADSQDVQWYKTPNLDDKKQFRYNNAGNLRYVDSVMHRDNMYVTQFVCHYGQAGGEGCGYIAGRSLDPDEYAGTNKFNATFIRVEDDQTTNGDSGAPWFSLGTAFGIHKGSTPGSPGIPSYPFFMAQNYMSALGIHIRVTG